MRSVLPQVGAVILDGSRTRFTVWAPLHERMGVVFSDSGRIEEMVAEADGYHTLVTNAPAGTRYQLRFTDGRLRPDPASLAQPDGVHGASMVVERNQTGGAAAFMNPALPHHVLYELHVGTFTPGGTFEAVIPRLADLRRLGVTAIELMPIGQFPGERNWGYDGVGLFAAQWSYGGLAGLRRLVRASHEQGLGVILDAVYNHLGPEGNYLAEFGPYFTDRYRTPWGAALNFDGHGSDHVREFFIQNSLHWTRDCGIDGLRLDAVHAIVDHSASTFVEELTLRNHAEGDRSGRRVLIIAESSDNDPRLVRDRGVGGCGMDGCWNDDYHHAVRAALTGERRGYYRPFGDPAQIAKAVRDRFVFTGEYSSGHGRRHGAPAQDIDRGRLVVFTQNHDQVGNRATGDRLDRTAGRDGSRVAAALVLLSPFTPMLWMGEEYGEPAPFQYFVSHADAALVEAVRRGRASEFGEFVGSLELPDPQAAETLERSTLSWSLRETGQHAVMLAYYSALLGLRREFDIAARSASVASRSVGTIVVLEYAGEPRLAMAANVGTERAVLRPRDLGARPEHGWEVMLDSNDVCWGGTGAAGRAAWPADGEVSMDAKTAVVLSAVKERR